MLGFMLIQLQEHKWLGCDAERGGLVRSLLSGLFHFLFSDVEVGDLRRPLEIFHSSLGIQCLHGAHFAHLTSIYSVQRHSIQLYASNFVAAVWV